MKTKIFLRLLLVFAIAAPVSSGQSSSPPASPKSGSSGGESGQSDEVHLGFSIETEMLTYKSLEANSEAVACDIARHLFGGEIRTTIGDRSMHDPVRREYRRRGGDRLVHNDGIQRFSNVARGHGLDERARAQGE
jgi:hypothetical protein